MNLSNYKSWVSSAYNCCFASSLFFFERIPKLRAIDNEAAFFGLFTGCCSRSIGVAFSQLMPVPFKVDGVKIRPQSTTRQSPLLSLRLEIFASNPRRRTISNTPVESSMQLPRLHRVFNLDRSLTPQELSRKTGKLCR